MKTKRIARVLVIALFVISAFQASLCLLRRKTRVCMKRCFLFQRAKMEYIMLELVFLKLLLGGQQL